MVLNVKIFNDPGALVDFVNDNTITAANITRIEQRDGKWYLFYWV
jgi:hypothetical protein